jgi:hypothetical protein
LVRKWSTDYNFKVTPLCLDSCALQGVLLLPFFCYGIFSNLTTLEGSLYFIGFSLVSCVGAVLMGMSVNKGQAGPASALLQVSIPVMMLLMIIFCN